MIATSLYIIAMAMGGSIGPTDRSREQPNSKCLRPGSYPLRRVFYIVKHKNKILLLS